MSSGFSSWSAVDARSHLLGRDRVAVFTVERVDDHAGGEEPLERQPSIVWEGLPWIVEL